MNLNGCMFITEALPSLSLGGKAVKVQKRMDSIFFMLGISFKCLAVGFTSMFYRSGVKQVFDFFLHYHLSVSHKFSAALLWV